jgi:hypothetical protein
MLNFPLEQRTIQAPREPEYDKDLAAREVLPVVTGQTRPA